jgi:hypothetical protein
VHDEVFFSGSCFGTGNLLGTRTCCQISAAPFYQLLSVQVNRPGRIVGTKRLAFYAYTMPVTVAAFQINKQQFRHDLHIHEVIIMALYFVICYVRHSHISGL